MFSLPRHPSPSSSTPVLLDMTGVGAVTAAVILTVWSHPGRVRSQAALAQIAGTCPIPASSANTTRHRLNRGGDRQLNRAINTIVLTRMRMDPATRAYVARRTAEGRTKREITRCLKRYVTRQIHRTLTEASRPSAIFAMEPISDAFNGTVLLSARSTSCRVPAMMSTIGSPTCPGRR